ncbi:MAG TPA: hypothetical protein VGL21_01240 [Jatrophihabitantaceae bacterium]
MRGGGEQLSAARRDAPAVRKQLTGVLEQDDAVAQKAPALLRMRGEDMRSISVERIGRRARRDMSARAQRVGYLSVGEHFLFL